MASKKKLLLLLILLVFTSRITFAQSKPEDCIKGVWLTEKKDGKVEIFRSGNTWSGRLIWGNSVLDQNGKPKHDALNPDEKLRNRELQGMVILTGLVYEDGKWRNGNIYDSTSGKSYHVIVSIEGNSLSLRGYIGVPLLGKTTVWQRLSE